MERDLGFLGSEIKISLGAIKNILISSNLGVLRTQVHT